ncbi:unnamed protein product [Ixodes persulcatus]
MKRNDTSALARNSVQVHSIFSCTLILCGRPIITLSIFRCFVPTRVLSRSAPRKQSVMAVHTGISTRKPATSLGLTRIWGAKLLRFPSGSCLSCNALTLSRTETRQGRVWYFDFSIWTHMRWQCSDHLLDAERIGRVSSSFSKQC